VEISDYRVGTDATKDEGRTCSEKSVRELNCECLIMCSILLLFVCNCMSSLLSE
jgi:hypothetical protein